MGLASLRESNYSRRIVSSSVPKIHMSPNLLLVFVPGDRRSKAKKDATTQQKTKAGITLARQQQKSQQLGFARQLVSSRTLRQRALQQMSSYHPVQALLGFLGLCKRFNFGCLASTQQKTKARITNMTTVAHDSLMAKHPQLRLCHALPDSSFLQERFARAPCSR